MRRVFGTVTVTSQREPRLGEFAEFSGSALVDKGTHLTAHSALGSMHVEILVNRFIEEAFAAEHGFRLRETESFYVSRLSFISRDSSLRSSQKPDFESISHLLLTSPDEILLGKDVRAMSHARFIGLREPDDRRLEKPIVKLRGAISLEMSQHPGMLDGVRELFKKKAEIIDKIRWDGDPGAEQVTMDSLFRRRELEEISSFAAVRRYVNRKLPLFTSYMLKAAKGLLWEGDLAAIRDAFDSTTAAKLTIVCNDRNKDSGRPRLRENGETETLRRDIEEREPQVRSILGFVRLLDSLKDKKFGSSGEFLEKATSFGKFTTDWFDGLDKYDRARLVQYAVGANERIPVPGAKGPEKYLNPWFEQLPSGAKWRDFVGGYFVRKRLREEANRLNTEIKNSETRSDIKLRQA